MAKKKDFEGWLVGAACVGVGLLFLYYAGTGLGNENDAALIPNTLEDEIDELIAALNNRFGKDWVEFGLKTLEDYPRNALPASLVAFVAVVVEVENSSKRRLMTSYDKQQLAVQFARAR
jgi:hypothetical protein